MVLAMDVYYKEDIAKSVGVLFEWDDEQPREIIIEMINGIADYEPGQFYKRELPCLLKIIDRVNLKEIEAIIIDGYTVIDDSNTLGLGGILYETINKQVPVIGVAKTPFYKNKNTVTPLLRGKSKRPLYISCIGCEVDSIIERVKNMKGEYRMPNILKELDRVTREGFGE